MIWPKPRTSFRPSFSYGFAQASHLIWKRLGPDLAPHLDLPPSTHHPSTTSTSKWVELRNHLTRANLEQAKTRLVDGLNRGRCAPRSGVTG